MYISPATNSKNLGTMKKILLTFLSVCFITNLFAQSTCFTTTDGVDASGWGYKDYIIPTGYRLDSVYMNATRPGYPSYDYDLVIESCQGTTVYNHSIGTYPIDYTSDTNSEYNVWINLMAFNYVSIGMVRVSLPTDAGAIWNQVCFAVSPLSCIPPISSSCSEGGYIDTVIINTLNNSGSGCNGNANNYIIYPSSTFTTTLTAGTTYPFNLGTGPNAINYGVWIDFNNNGLYEANEYVDSSLVQANSFAGTITIPTGASIGMRGMRFRVKYSQLHSTDGCTNSGFGETEDYAIAIAGVTTHIQEFSIKSEINVFPNPSSGAFTVNVQNSVEHRELVIIDCLGREVFRKDISEGKNLVEINQLSKGIYFLKINGCKEKIIVKN